MERYEIDKFKEQFIKAMHVQMAQAGRVLNESEILIIDEFVRLIKVNGLDLTKRP